MIQASGILWRWAKIMKPSNTAVLLTSTIRSAQSAGVCNEENSQKGRLQSVERNSDLPN